MKRSLLSIAVLLCCTFSHSQIRIAILGSSTAFGAGSTSYDSSWAGRVQAQYRKNTNAGDPDTLVTINGGYGYTTYRVLPTGYTAPLQAQRQPVDETQNITVALSTNPDIVIINLPSNDVGYANPFWNPPYTVKESMDNFRVLYNAVVSQGKKCYVTCSQTRNDYDAYQRQLLKDLKDSILLAFGANAIDYFDDLATTDGTIRLRDEVRHIGYPDADYHLNDYGHRLIYQRVAAKNIFSSQGPLPLRLSSFSAQLKNGKALLHWTTVDEEGNTYFEVQKSKEGQVFETVYLLKAQGGQTNEYSWEDGKVYEGKTFYRLKMVEGGKLSFSKVVSVSLTPLPLAVETIFVQGNNLHAKVRTQKATKITFNIIAANGYVLQTQTSTVQANSQSIVLLIGHLSAGHYFLQVVSATGTDIKPFQKML